MKVNGQNNGFNTSLWTWQFSCTLTAIMLFLKKALISQKKKF